MQSLACAVLCAQEYSFRFFGTADGLTNLAVRNIYQDQVGFIWVSTENGIFRYDGDRFEAFGPAQGIPQNSGASFGMAPDRTLLVGGDFGLYHLVSNRFEKISALFKTISWPQGIASDDAGHTFLGTDSGLMEISSGTAPDQFDLRPIPAPPGVTGPEAFGVMAEGKNLWYGCGQQLCLIQPGRTRVFGRENGLPGTPVLAIAKDADGSIWVRARNATVFVQMAGQSAFRPANAPPGTVFSGGPAIDGEKRILLASPDGLLIHHRFGWQKIDRRVGLRGTVYSIFEDKQHILWIGLAGRGLAQWRGYQEWESYSTASGLSSDIVYSILPRPNGDLWVATEGGLIRGEPQDAGFRWKSVPGLNTLPVHSLQMSQDRILWIGTETKGIARLDVPTGRVEWFGERQGLTARAPYTLRIDRRQRLWAATDAGLFVSSAPYRSFARVTDLPSTRIWTVVEGTDGVIWAGGRNGLFSNADGRWQNWTRAQGLTNQEVLSLGAGPNGTIWVGYRFGGGIDRVHLQHDGLAVEKGVQRRGSDGLVYFLEFDSKGRLWAGTEHGVDMWDGARWTHYDMTDGLVWDDCDLGGFAEGPDGTFWIGTSGGLSRFKPQARAPYDVPIEIVFTRIMMGKTDVSSERDPAFPSGSNSLDVRYSALNALRQNGVVFRYRLEGANSAWTETTERELQFARLAPGAYRLEIQAKDSEGRQSRGTAQFPFSILTPWYLRWWFLGACTLVPLIVFLLVLRLRVRGAQRRERELLRIVDEKTRELRAANQELLRLSTLDPLTGLANRRVFDEQLALECSRLNRGTSTSSLVIFDADHFKLLNDSQGHRRGDEYLILLARELTRIARRQIDTAARIGGEEFALILPETSAADARRIAESARTAIADLRLPHPASPVAPFLTVSAGVATASWNRWSTPGQLLAAADKALYHAKDMGRNNVQVAPAEILAPVHEGSGN